MSGHVDFEEVNLRFYLKRIEVSEEVKRGVVFIKEIVPKPMITFIANTLFKEHYVTMEMSHLCDETKNSRIVKYTWYAYEIENSISVEAQKESKVISPDSK